MPRRTIKSDQNIQNQESSFITREGSVVVDDPPAITSQIVTIQEGDNVMLITTRRGKVRGKEGTRLNILWSDGISSRIDESRVVRV